MPQSPRRWGHAFSIDGLWTLFLSMLLVIASAGVLLAVAWLRVRKVSSRQHVLPDNVDCLLVFGKQLQTDAQPDAHYLARLEHVLSILEARPGLPVLLLGGVTGAGNSEAQAGLDWLTRHSLPGNPMLLVEADSRDTLENLRNASRLMRTHDLCHAAMISNGWHMARCQVFAKVLRLRATPCAASTQLPRQAYFEIREAFYLIWFQVVRGWAWITGRYDRISGR